MCRWISHGDTPLLLDPPGVGKTHLAVALGREAIIQNQSVLFISAVALLTQLVKAHQVGKLEEKISYYNKQSLTSV